MSEYSILILALSNSILILIASNESPPISKKLLLTPNFFSLRTFFHASKIVLSITFSGISKFSSLLLILYCCNFFLSIFPFEVSGKLSIFSYILGII
ncbi:hypothetical protein D3C73_1127640 [compost metagenome]